MLKTHRTKTTLATNEPKEPKAATKASPPVQLATALITFYQKCISPALGPRCRFYPSCSQYARLSLQKYGLGMGLLKSACRVCKCHPFHKGGVDYP